MQGHILKFAGAIIVIISCFVIGLSKALNLKYRKKCLEEIIASLNIASAEMTSLLTPTPEIFKKLSSEFSGAVGNFYSYISKIASKNDWEDLSTAWVQGVREYLSCLSKTQQEELIRLSYVMGKYDGSKQALSLKAAIMHLERELAFTGEISKEAMRLYCGIGLCSGLMLAFALI